MVGGMGPNITILLSRGAQPMSKDEALNLAAWLVALADPLEEKFPAILEEVMSS